MQICVGSGKVDLRSFEDANKFRDDEGQKNKKRNTQKGQHNDGIGKCGSNLGFYLVFMFKDIYQTLQYFRQCAAGFSSAQHTAVER